MGKRGNQVIRSNKLVHPGYKHGQVAKEKRPAGVSQYGSSIGNHAMNDSKKHQGGVEEVRGSRKPISGELGNKIAETTVCKPGGSRNLYGQAGTQKTYN